MRSWLAMLLCVCSLAAQAQGSGDLYVQVATMNAGRQVAPGSAEAKQAEQYLRGISKAYNVPEDNVATTATAALKALRGKRKEATLYEVFEAALRIAPSESSKTRDGLVHALTTYIGAYDVKAGAQAHEKSINEVIAINKAGAPK